MIYMNSKIYPILRVMIILLGIQVIRIVIKQILFQFIEKSALNNDLISLLEMLLIIVFILIICNNQKINLSILPHIKNKSEKSGYFIATIVVLFLIILPSILNDGFSFNDIIILILSTVVTPVFEELIFRGYVWNELKNYYTNQFIIYIINTLLFAIWHLGYIDSIWLKMSLMGYASEVPFAMFMKIITGLCFGIVIGFVRCKLKNCYATILVHSFMNIFGR